MHEDWLVKQFEAHRAHLRDVAYRMLGSPMEADDAVQDTWLRMSRADVTSVENLGGWLTTVVARVCLDVLRRRRARSEQALEENLPEPAALSEEGGEKEREALLADSVGEALLLVLDTLAPAERLAFVLHDMFAVTFEEIAPIVGRSATAARQLASRARRRVRSVSGASEGDLARQREVVSAFLAASREGDFDRLVALLDPQIVLRADQVAVDAARTRQAAGAPTLSREVCGSSKVAKAFVGRARDARLALIDGRVGAAWAPGGRPRAVFNFTISGGKVGAIDILVDPQTLGRLEVKLFEGN